MKWHLPPGVHAVAAATGCSMLGFENGMATHGGLFSVVGRICWGEPHTDKVFRVASDGIEAFGGNVVALSL